MVRERFSDWGLYHKIIVAVLAAVVVGVSSRAILVIDGAFEVTDEIVINAGASEIWPWVIDNKLRTDWQGEIIRIQGRSTDVGRNRLVYWKRRYARWRTYEVTTAVVAERLFETEQEGDMDRRWWRTELVPEGPCQTRVKLRELIQPHEYSDRFWFFRVDEERQQRLAHSVAALKRWVESKETSCPAKAADAPG